MVTALGHSKCDDAIDVLLDVEITGGNRLKEIAGEWIEAVAELNTTESRQILLSFVDPNMKFSRADSPLDYLEHQKLASHIAKMARAEPEIRDRLYLLCAGQLPTRARLLLGGILNAAGNHESFAHELRPSPR